MNIRTPDTQYQTRIRQILAEGTLVKNTPQGVGAYTCFGTLAPMVFPVENGAPVITERSMKSFWRAPIGELFAFMNGVRDQSTLEREYGVKWWNKWTTAEKCRKIGVPEGDLGPGSYGGAFHDFPMPDGRGFDQIAHVIEQLRDEKLRNRRTIFVSPWIPFWNGWGGLQKAVVSPCHGWMHLRVMEGRLYLHMFQRSGDFPVGVPSNMIQYFALLLALSHVIGIPPAHYSHSVSDAHIYEDQENEMRVLVQRSARPFPLLALDKGVTRLSDFRPHHFELLEYDPHPPLNIPVSI